MYIVNMYARIILMLMIVYRSIYKHLFHMYINMYSVYYTHTSATSICYVSDLDTHQIA
jgi:hypothetical protein